MTITRLTDFEADVVERRVMAERLGNVWSSMLIGGTLPLTAQGSVISEYQCCSRVPEIRAALSIRAAFERQRHESQHCQDRGHGKGRNDVVLVVKNLDMQRQRIGFAANVPETTDTAPNSPIARAVQRITP